MGCVRHRRRKVAHIHVDPVAEDEDLHQGDADDHAAGEPIAPQLADLLAGDRGHAHEEGGHRVHGLAGVFKVAATNTSSRLARTSST